MIVVVVCDIINVNIKCSGVANVLQDIDFSQFRVLLVEDNDFVRYMVKKHLRDFGFKDVFEAANGAEGIQLLMREPDLIICDISMEPMNGFQFLEYVRNAGDVQSKLPFIFLTSNAEAAAVQKAIDMKIDAYLLKPITPEVLRRKIITIFQKVMSS